MEVGHLLCACQAKMLIGISDKIFIFIPSSFFNRVKYYCSICYPLLDNLTESQLKHMRKCSHSEIFNNICIVEQTNQKQAIVIVDDDDVSQPLISSQAKQIHFPCRSYSKTYVQYFRN